MSTIHRGGQQAGNHPAANGAAPDPANTALKRKLAQGKTTPNRNLTEPGAIPLARTGAKPPGANPANLAQALAAVQGRGAASTAQGAAALSTNKAPGQPQSKIVRAPSNPTTNAARREASTNFEVAMPPEGRKQGEGGSQGQGQGQGQGHSQGQGHQGQGQGRGRGEGGRDSNRQSNPSESWVPPSAQLAPKSRVSTRYLDQHGMSAKESRPSRNGQSHGSHAPVDQGVPARMLNYCQNLVATMLGRSPEQFQARGESIYKESQRGRDDHRIERQPPFRSTRLSVPVEKPGFQLGDMFRQLVSGGQGRLHAG